MSFDYDLFVIGAGSGGVRAARLAGARGLKVAIAEEDRPGGTCVLRGCVPKKFMLYAAQAPEQAKYMQGFGWDVVLKGFDWGHFKKAMESELDRLSHAYQSTLKNNHVTLYDGRATLTSGHGVRVTKSDGTVSDLTAKYILVAVGGWPYLPENIEGARQFGLSSNEVFKLNNLPKSILVVGGGYIAVEFAGIFNGLGVKTTLSYRGEQILRGFDGDVRTYLSEEMSARGIEILTHSEPISLTPSPTDEEPHGVVVGFKDGTTARFGACLFAVGRVPKTQGLGLEEAGIALTKNGAIKVDSYSKTAIDHIYAVGDVTDRVNLTPVAIREGAAFVETVFGENPTAYDHDTIPTAVFSQPEIGTVGLSEDEARAKGFEIVVYKTRFRMMKTTFVGGTTRIFMKLVVDKNTDVVLGAHMLGGEAAEIIQLAGIAVKAKLTKAQWDATCAVHPSAAEEFVTLK